MHIITIGLHKQNVPDVLWQRSSEQPEIFYHFIKNHIDEKPNSEFLFVDASYAKEIVAVVEETTNISEQVKSFFYRYFSASGDIDFMFHELTGPEAVKHFLELAIGLEPAVSGQQEFLQQASESIVLANRGNIAGPVINRLYQGALMLRGKVSKNDVAVDTSQLSRQILELVEKIFGARHKLNIVVLGENEFGLPLIEENFPAIKNKIRFFSNLLYSEKAGDASSPEALFQDAQVIFRLNQAASNFFTASRLTKLMQKRKNYPLLIINLDSTIASESSVNRIYNLYNYDLADFGFAEGADVQGRNIRELLDLELKEFFNWFYSNQYQRFGNIVVKSPAMERVMEMIARIAQTDITVLIEGESGTGKEIVARTIHENSLRKRRPFVVVNCGALTETLLESELFGHEKGAFTGATYTKKGLFEQAHTGTIFLDEIGDTSPALQTKLLRVLQEGEIKRVGSTETIKIDVRLIAATNQYLEDLVRKNRFRQDLFYRLNVVHLRLPPLRERKEEILPLAEFFLQKYSDKMKKRVTGFTERARRLLESYHWPGNVRELENAIERAVALAIGNVVHSADLPDAVRNRTRTIKQFPMSEKPMTLKEMEKEWIKMTLIAENWNYERVAEILDIGRTTLWRKMKEYGIKKED